MKHLGLVLTLALAIFSHSALAADPINTGFFSNKAIQGYDSVAYHTDNAALEGNSDFSFEYMGATWLFVSEANRDLFAANPEAYAPQYGGYCAYAVSQGYTASIEPDQFTVVDGKLYLNYNADVKAKWLTDQAAYIQAADVNWPGLHD